MSNYILRKGRATLADLANGNSAIQTLMAAGGNWYYFDPTNGLAAGDGLTPQSASNNLEAMYALLRSGYNDGIVFIGGATAYNPAATIAWDKNYAHLIGVSANLPGVGQRCRIVALAVTDLTVPLTIGGAGCVFSNLQINNEHADTAATGCVSITGARNEFNNVFFMAPTSDTAASYSCKLASAENVFIRCTFGQFTNFRADATYGLWLTGAGNVSRNKFIGCELLAWVGGPSTHVHFYHDSTLNAVPTVTWFEDTLFHTNYGGGTIQVQAIDDNSTAAGHQIVLRGNCNVLGCTAVADNLTYLFTRDIQGAHNVSGLLMIAVAES